MKENKLNTIFTWFILAIVFLLPILFLPFFVNPFVTSKLMLVSLVGLVTAFVFVGKSMWEKNWEITKNPLSTPLAIFATLVIISSLASHQYPLKQFLGMGGVYLSFALIVLLGSSLLKTKLTKWFSLLTNLSALILSILSILQVFGFGLGSLLSKITVFDLPNSLVFAISGATFITIQFLSVVLLSNLFDHKSLKNSLFLKIASGFSIIALIVNIWGVMPGKEANFQSLSFINSAVIAANSLTFTKNALLGYGPDSYGNAYSILKPNWINGSRNWKFIFDSAFNLPLTVIVSLGLIAFIVYLFLMWRIFILVKKSQSKEAYLRAFVFGSLIWQLLSPINLTMFILFAIALAFLISAEQDHFKKISFNIHRLSDLLNRGKWIRARSLFFFGTNLILIVGLVLASIISVKAFLAYNLLYRGNGSIINNQASKAYDHHQKAKELAPQIDFVRRSNALINLQIAIALSNKADIAAAEQEQVLQLVNQAIREAKAAAVLEPSNYQNWLILAQIYMQLLGTTDQAAQEAFNALAKAATYNPNDPELRIGLGELFLKTNRPAEAVVFLAQAVERKPNLFAAHYYLSKALLANNQLEEAKTSLTNGLSLLEKDSEDYKKVEEEIKSIDKQMEDGVKNTSSSATESASLATDPSTNMEDSALSDLLSKQETETVIQEGALSSDQNLVEN